VIDPDVQALESLLARKREAGAVLLEHDMWDRYGSQHATSEEIAERTARAETAQREHAATIHKVEALVEKLRGTNPGAITAWAVAHEQLLAAFLATTTDDTARFVATGERAAWAEVARGERSFVDENYFYIKFDPARYRELFGFDP
jgi:hypothetical protein